MDTFDEARDPNGSAAMRALEEQLSFQQRQLDEFNAVVLKQQVEMEQQRREIARLIEAVRGLANRVGEDLPHEKPPHY